MEDSPSFALRLRESQERQLRVRRALYVGIRRDWSRGSKIVLVKKAPSGDSIIAVGTLERVAELGDMDADEKKLCMDSNWYGKMLFSQVARFYPPIPVSATELAGVQPALLHGHAVSNVSKIEAMSAKIIA